MRFPPSGCAFLASNMEHLRRACSTPERTKVKNAVGTTYLDRLRASVTYITDKSFRTKSELTTLCFSLAPLPDLARDLMSCQQQVPAESPSSQLSHLSLTKPKVWRVFCKVQSFRENRPRETQKPLQERWAGSELQAENVRNERGNAVRTFRAP